MNPLVTGLFTAGLAFVLPVVVGLLSGNMSGRDFLIICALTVGGFVLGYALGVREQRKARPDST